MCSSNEIEVKATVFVIMHIINIVLLYFSIANSLDAFQLLNAQQYIEYDSEQITWTIHAIISYTI